MNIPVLAQIILATAAGGLLSVVVAALVMWGLPGRWLTRAVSFSTGLLLATALLHLLPDALESGLTPHEAFPLLLGGILGFFVLEKFALWRHVHVGAGDDAHANSAHCDDHTHAHHHVHGGAGGTLPILIGDGFHNFTDGLLLAAAFLADPALGWATAIAVLSHELPQEIGDFMVLLSAGVGKAKALALNALSGVAMVLGGVAGYFALDGMQAAVPYVLVIAAASFIYIAVADLVPELHRHRHLGNASGQLALLAAGIGTVQLIGLFAHHSH